jgi:hypothetical protein
MTLVIEEDGEGSSGRGKFEKFCSVKKEIP